MFGSVPAGAEALVDRVVPELQLRGILRTAYEGKTLRENLGLTRPPNRFSCENSVIEESAHPVTTITVINGQ